VRVAWEASLSAEERRVFLRDVEDQLQALEAAVLEAERQGLTDEALAAAFRAAHTLKGLAGAVGHEAMAHLAHAVEDVLDALRAGRLALDPEVTDALFRGVDALRGLARPGHARGDDAVVDRLVAAVRRGAPATAPGRAREAARGEGVAAWRVLVRLERDAPMPAVRAYQCLLAVQPFGLVASVPSVAEVEADWTGEVVELRVASGEPEALRQALRAVPEVAEVRVERAPAPAGPAPRRAEVTVRIAVEQLDELVDLVGELLVARTRLTQALRAAHALAPEAVRPLGQVSSHLARVTSQLRDRVVRLRLVPLEALFARMPRLVRDAARQVGKDVEFVADGHEIELDRGVVEAMGDPLVHLLRNAVDHGIEPPDVRRAVGKPPRGRIELTAERRENRIVLTVRDDGAGIDLEAVRAAAVRRGLLAAEAAQTLGREELVRLLFTPGFSTREQVTALSGRGVGLDVVRREVERLGGAIAVHTEPGRGTAFAIELPAALIRVLVVRVGEDLVALPLHAVVEAFRLSPAEVFGAAGAGQAVRFRGRVVPLVRGTALLGADAVAPPSANPPVVVLRSGERLLGLVVDALLGEEEVVVRRLDPRLGVARAVAGATILNDGRLALILDPTGVAA
jgi:two-component system chemotaxis sensor kinase CheA